MKNILKLEELFMLGLGIFLFNELHFSWWLFLALLLVPDISMLGYLFGTKVGAVTYNVAHHKGLAITLFLIGVYLESEYVKLAGIILFSHASLDRVFGYGLKYQDDFKNTHLGKIGKA